MSARRILVEVAGKRASLAQLNRILLEIPGVQDGVFLMGEARRAGGAVDGGGGGAGIA